LHNEAFLDFESSSNVNKIIAWRRIRLAKHVVCLGKGDIHTVMKGKNEENT
jgi:hypothetical protein